MKDFTQFLQNIHIQLFPDLVDDELSDSFDTWISEKDTDEIIKLATLYGQDQFNAGQSSILKNE